jgi:predicted MFS family arabinose efflux permease
MAETSSRIGKRLGSRLGVFFAAVYFVQGIGEPGAGIASQPIFFLLKDELHLNAAETAAFLATISIAWGIKPLYGLLSDFFPLFGYRRKSYLVLMTSVAAASWLALAVQPHHTYLALLVPLLLCGLGLAFSDVLCDAVMVETGKPLGLTGRFQAIQWGAINFASVLAGIGGGWLSQNVSYQSTFRFVALFPLITLMATILCVREPRVGFDLSQVRETLRAVRSAVSTPPLWTAAGFIFLWNFSPSFGTPLEYFEVDTLGFSKIFLGTLYSLGSAGAIAGAAIFNRVSGRLPMRRLLTLSVGIGVVSTLAYLGLVGPRSAVILTIVTGTISMVASLATLDLAARSCPSRAEGTFFAALMSLANLGTAGGSFVGGRLYDALGLTPLILISALATALCWVIIPLIRIDGPAANALHPEAHVA